MAPTIPVLDSKFGKPQDAQILGQVTPKASSKGYLAIDPNIARDVVGKSHSDLEGVKKIVDKRPELAKASWDWRFGDWETAIGAASHVGRRDIIEYLISMGARPDLFTFATLGAYQIVKSIIEYSPGIQKTLGPHGISIYDHAQAGLRMKDKMTDEQINDSEQLIDFLEGLGDAKGPEYLTISQAEKEQYLGDYKYGPGPGEGFTISLNMRKMISLGEIGTFGGAIYKMAENQFIYQGAPSVNVSFQYEIDKIISLTIKEPNRSLTATKVVG